MLLLIIKLHKKPNTIFKRGNEWDKEKKSESHSKRVTVGRYVNIVVVAAAAVVVVVVVVEEEASSS